MGDGINKQDSQSEGTNLPEHHSPQNHINPGVKSPPGGNTASSLPGQLPGFRVVSAPRVGGGMGEPATERNKPHLR